MKNLIDWLLDKWFEKYDKKYSESLETIETYVKNIKEDQNYILDQEKEHYKELRQRIEDTNIIVRQNSEQLRDIHLIISEFYERFKNKFPD